MAEAWNPRYVAYTRAHGLTAPAAMMARDRGRKASHFRPREYEEHLHAPVSPAAQEGVVHLREVVSAVRQLPEGHQQALKLVVGGMSYEGAAERMGVPLGTVRSRLFRARKALSEDAR